MKTDILADECSITKKGERRWEEKGKQMTIHGQKRHTSQSRPNG